MSALRLARGFTGRDRIVKFEGCYHGHADSLLVKAGSGALTLGEPSSPGVPAALAELTRWFHNGFALVAGAVRNRPGASEARCWPHHFDVGNGMQGAKQPVQHRRFEQQRIAPQLPFIAGQAMHVDGFAYGAGAGAGEHPHPGRLAADISLWGQPAAVQERPLAGMRVGVQPVI